jgi:hypothetical protein
MPPLEGLLDPGIASRGLLRLVVAPSVSLRQHISHPGRFYRAAHDRISKRGGVQDRFGDRCWHRLRGQTEALGNQVTEEHSDDVRTTAQQIRQAPLVLQLDL